MDFDISGYVSYCKLELSLQLLQRSVDGFGEQRIIFGIAPVDDKGISFLI